MSSKSGPTQAVSAAPPAGAQGQPAGPAPVDFEVFGQLMDALAEPTADPAVVWPLFAKVGPEGQRMAMTDANLGPKLRNLGAGAGPGQAETSSIGDMASAGSDMLSWAAEEGAELANRATETIGGAVTAATSAAGGLLGWVLSADDGNPENTGAPAGAGATPANQSTGEPALEVPPAEAPTVGPIDPANHQSRATFVRKPQVQENSKTTGILDTIWPYYDKGDLVIGGYLTDDQQAWKMNWHWEAMLLSIDKALAADIGAEHVATLNDIAADLRAVPPDPPSGYFDDATPGETVDTSSPDAAEERFAVVSDAKKRLGAVYEAVQIWDLSSAYDRNHWERCYAPIMPPGKSKHGLGYALDIEGDNARIKKVSKSLGATMTFDEKAHVHVEFSGGVKPPGSGEGAA